MPKTINEVGNIYGELTVIKRNAWDNPWDFTMKRDCLQMVHYCLLMITKIRKQRFNVLCFQVSIKVVKEFTKN